MFDYPTTSASCCTGASVGITAMIAAVMSLLSFAVLSPHRVSANVKRGVMLSVLALMAVLAASSARADYAPTYKWSAAQSTFHDTALQACQYTLNVQFGGGSAGTRNCTTNYCECITTNNGNQFSGTGRVGTCPYGGALSGSVCTGNPVCPPGQAYDGAICVPIDCGARGTLNPATNTCTCDAESYRASSGVGETCRTCPSPGYILGEAPTYFSGQGEVPAELCLEPADSIGGAGCSRDTQRSIRQGTSYAAIAMRWTGNSCTVQADGPSVGPPDASPDNPNSPDDCLSAGMGYVTTGGATQCVQNGTDTNPVTTTTKGTATNSDGSKTVTTTTTTSTTNNTHTSSTSVTYNNGNTQGEGDKTETSETSAGTTGTTTADKSCGAPGQPACRVTITGGTGEGDVASLNLPSVAGAFDGEAEKGLLGGPLSSFLSDARSKLEDAVMLPDLAPGSCQSLALWDGIVLDVCPMVETAREIVAWIFYAAALWFGWMQLQRAIDRGAA